MITTQATTYGTAHFQSVEAAIRHFGGTTDNPRAFVAHGIAAGDIIIGRPLLRHGQALAVINGRYHITETMSPLAEEVFDLANQINRQRADEIAENARREAV